MIKRNIETDARDAGHRIRDACFEAGQKSEGASLDRFGLFNSTAGGQMVKMYLDDLKYTAHPVR